MLIPADKSMKKDSIELCMGFFFKKKKEEINKMFNGIS